MNDRRDFEDREKKNGRKIRSINVFGRNGVVFYLMQCKMNCEGISIRFGFFQTSVDVFC